MAAIRVPNNFAYLRPTANVADLLASLRLETPELSFVLSQDPVFSKCGDPAGSANLARAWWI